MRGQQPWLVNRSRALRNRQSSAEEKLWTHLRDRQLGGFKFVRQISIGAHLADFVCRERKLVVEVDGATHSTDTELQRDIERTAKFEQLGYRVFRAHNSEVYDNINGVLDTLLAELSKSAQGKSSSTAAPHPDPLPIVKDDGEREKKDTAQRD